jgi:hypothetical protein
MKARRGNPILSAIAAPKPERCVKGYELDFPSGGDFYGNEKDCRAVFAQFVSNRSIFPGSSAKARS